MTPLRALVTGAGSGIGLALVRLLRERGAEVTAADVAAGSESAVAELGARFVRADVASPGDWESLAASTGPLDRAFLNAGVASGGRPFLQTPPAVAARVLEVNVLGVILGLAALAPLLARGRDAAVVATGSTASLRPVPDVAYTASKHAVLGAVRASAVQLASRGVRAAVLCPGETDTPMLGGAGRALRRIGHPLLDPRDVADALLAVGDRTGPGETWVLPAGGSLERLDGGREDAPGRGA